MNFVGARKVTGWKERTSFEKKVAALQSSLNFSFDAECDPMKTIVVLKNARNAMAHGQPVAFEVSVESHRDVAKSMQPEWALVAAPDFVLAAFDQVNDFKRVLFRRARIKPGSSYTTAEAVAGET